MINLLPEIPTQLTFPAQNIIDTSKLLVNSFDTVTSYTLLLSRNTITTGLTAVRYRPFMQSMIQKMSAASKSVDPYFRLKLDNALPIILHLEKQLFR
jgi:hypothetical protein